jgi:dihydroneopterin aldolase
MDRIILSGVEVYAYGGVTDAERSIGQRYRMDIEVGVDLRHAARTDRVEDTVSYAEIHEEAVRVLRERPFQLIESAAGRIAGRVLERFAVEWVIVRLAKLLPPIDGVVASAAVEIRRDRDRG